MSVLADSLIDEVDGNLPRALHVAECVLASIEDVVLELRRRICDEH